MDVKNPHILIVDDNQKFANDLKNKLEDIASVKVVYSEEEFKTIFSPYKFDLILLDLRLKEAKEGLDLLEMIVDEDPSAVVIVVSGYGDIATAVEALHKGAKTFLEKDKMELDEIKLRVELTLKETNVERKIRHLEAMFQKNEEIIGNDPKMLDIKRYINLVAQDGEATVLIRGETGTGKELVARAIHSQGVRKEGPFISVALTDINPEIITSELFGHERGAFTGATSRHRGLFEQAHRGVLFLDEIGELPLDVQVKLLRVLDQRKFRRMGGKKYIEVDVQLVTATNRPLEEMVKEGKFREDLYYRLKVFEINLPPLRDRGGDIELLAVYFLNQLKKKGRTPAKGFSQEALAMLLNHHWPGNVRELKAVIESAGLRCRLEGQDKIMPKHISPFLYKKEDNSERAISELNVSKKLAETELELIETALRHSGGRKTEAWKLLGYSNRFSMLRRVKKIIGDFPELVERFPLIKRSYFKGEEPLNSR